MYRLMKKNKKKSPFQKRLIPFPLRLHVAIETLQKIFRLTIFFVRRPIAADFGAQRSINAQYPRRQPTAMCRASSAAGQFSHCQTPF